MSAAGRPLSAVARLPTGIKIFLIISTALLPLALIAMVATLQITRLADAETRARLRVATDESARAIAIELGGDMSALRVAVAALAADPGDAPSCARAQGVFAQQAARGTRFAILDRSGHLLCGQAVAAAAMDSDAPRGPIHAAIVPGEGLVLETAGPRRNLVARAFFSLDFLRQLGTPSTRESIYASELVQEGEALDLFPDRERAAFDRVETVMIDLGIDDLALRSSVRRAPISSSLVVALLLPLVMWAAAAGIAWFVVDRLLIRPLRQLRAGVAAYRPGEEIETGIVRQMPAQEIRELGETFRAISRTVAVHEAGLAEGVVRQTKLTREVHHRVKNNLQVIASLISFHARSAVSPDAAAAYASIQRRVDALAVVHRNHFAEMEESRGLNLRAMIGELAGNIRATAPESSHGMGITLEVEPLFVNQDVAVAVAFLITETIELALSVDPVAQIRVAMRQDADAPDRGTIRIVSRALVESDLLKERIGGRYGRVLEGLSRQLRSKLHQDPLSGAFEISVAILGRD
nr:histidine kinase dimerization/phosphoacceptor domain -containing protein [Sphingomonas gellani]